MEPYLGSQSGRRNGTTSKDQTGNPTDQTAMQLNFHAAFAPGRQGTMAGEEEGARRRRAEVDGGLQIFQVRVANHPPPSDDQRRRLFFSLRFSLAVDAVG